MTDKETQRQAGKSWEEKGLDRIEEKRDVIAYKNKLVTVIGSDDWEFLISMSRKGLEMEKTLKWILKYIKSTVGQYDGVNHKADVEEFLAAIEKVLETNKEETK